jgi:hypothetical protein
MLMVAPPETTCSRAGGSLRVYVAAPYQRAGLVRAMMATTRVALLRWTSRWATNARGAERLETLTRAEQQRLAKDNDEDLADSHVVLSIAFPREGGEMFSEIGRALLQGIPVVWAGARRTLSAAREGVLFADDLETAVQLLADIAELASAAGGDAAWIRRRIWATLEADFLDSTRCTVAMENVHGR